MPHSYHFGKPEAIEFITKHVSSDKRILDVGPGVGTYADLLNPLGYSMDCLEICSGYVDAYELPSKYRNVYIGNVVEYDISDYDFVILGDVLEHLSIDAARYVLSRCKNYLAAVPYRCPQAGVSFSHNGYELNNPHERHIQDDLTPLVMLTRYPGIELIWSNHLYGYYSNIRWPGYYPNQQGNTQ